MKGIRNYVMKKKVFAVLIAILLVLSALPGAAFAGDDDEIPEYFTLDSVWNALHWGKGQSEEGFAKLVYNTIVADESFDLSAYTNVTDALAAYTGEIKLTADDDPIYGIMGIDLLPNARIILEHSKIINLHPLGGTESRGEPVSVNYNPIYIWPANIPNLPTSGATYSIPTDFRSKGTAVYINDGVSKSQTVTFDVKVDGENVWDFDPNPYTGKNNSYFETSGNSEVISIFGKKSESVSFGISGPGYSLARMAIPAFVYVTSSGQPQSVWPAYQYRIDSVFYNTLKVNTEVTTTGGFYLLKVKAGTERDLEPVIVEGATYALYSDEDCQTPVTGYEAIVTEGEPLLVDGLAPGTYYLKEVTPAPWYHISDAVTEIVIPEAEAPYTVDGLKELEVTTDRSRWKNDWLSNDDLTDLTLYCLDYPETAVAGEGKYADYALFIGGPEGYTVKELEMVTDPDEIGYNVTYEGALITYGNQEVSVDADEDVVAVINDIIPDYDGNFEVTLYGSYEQVVAPATNMIMVTDEPITIWVENTTGDEKGTPNFKKDAGGYVYICIDEEGTKSTISSDEPVNGTGDDNRVNRQMCYKACGVADVENGWKIATDRIQVGSMGADGKSGALTYITQLPKYTEEAVEYYNEETGEFRFLDAASEKYIMGKLNYDAENQTACVEIIEMDQNIDVAIPFYKEAPQTGMNGMILLWSMLLVAAVYVMAAFRKARKAL